MSEAINPIGLDLRSHSDAYPGGGPRTLASAIYAQVRADILSCQLRPGEKLLVGPLSRRFDVSVASVREALFRLVADGLVQTEDHRGFRIQPLSLADLRDVSRTRIEIECLALRRSIERGDPAWRESLERSWARLTSLPHSPPDDPGLINEAWAAAHAHFHQALVSACGLEWLLRFRATLFEQSERYRRMSSAVTRGTRDRDGEHRRIFEAAMAGKADEAAAALADHFERTAASIANGFREPD